MKTKHLILILAMVFLVACGSEDDTSTDLIEDGINSDESSGAEQDEEEQEGGISITAPDPCDGNDAPECTEQEDDSNMEPVITPKPFNHPFSFNEN